MKPSEFKKLVEKGNLPPPVTLAKDLERWDVEQLKAILSGSLAAGEYLEW
jgi:hypothetical protein